MGADTPMAKASTPAKAPQAKPLAQNKSERKVRGGFIGAAQGLLGSEKSRRSTFLGSGG